MMQVLIKLKNKCNAKLLKTIMHSCKNNTTNKILYSVYYSIFAGSKELKTANSKQYFVNQFL